MQVKRISSEAEVKDMWPFGRRSSSDNPAPSRRRGERFSASWVGCSLGQVLDLSGFGIRVAAEFVTPPEIGQELAITLRYGKQPVVLPARVVRVRRIGKRWEVAMDFADVPPSVRADLHTLSRQRGARSTATPAGVDARSA